MSDAPAVPYRSSAAEWIWPLLFIAAFSWVTWNGAAYLIAAPGDPATEAALLRRYGPPQLLDWIALALVPVFLVAGVATVRRTPMEWEDFSLPDRLAVFIGRVAMMLIASLVCVMVYEVFVRYALEAPTLWANELSLWLAVFIFLLAGLYAMQQRSHIRIFLLYDVCPRWLQRLFDVISTALICLFAFMLFWGGFGEAWSKLLRWETFGTAYDPPIPATTKPLILLIVALVALQAVLNLIRDWNAEPVMHTAADDIDEADLARMRAQAGEVGVGDHDVTRDPIQNPHPRRD